MVYPAAGFAHSTGSAWDTPTSAEIQSLIGGGVYDASGAAATAQSNAEAASDPAGSASTAQSNAESYASNASNLASGTVAAARLPGATASAQGAVQLPTGASGNTLGAAAMQPTSAFDATGAAATAQSNAETYSQNASNINSGTLPHAQLPALVSADIPNNAANTSGTAAGISGTQTENTFLAAPNGSNGAAAFRAIVAADVPTLNQNTSGTAAGLTGTPSITVATVTASTINDSGTASAKLFAGSGSPTITLEQGTSALASAACATGDVCSGANGTIAITTGGSPATGEMLKISFPSSHANLPDCVTNLVLPGTGQNTNYEITYDSSTPYAHLYLYSRGTALAPSSTYNLVYWCPGY
jgi:hypothetical protein